METAWQTVSVVGYSLAGVLFAVAIFMFFKMKILAVIGDLSGRTAARQIQEIRERNTLTGNKLHQPDAFNLERGSLTEKVSLRTGKSGKIGKTAQTIAHQSRRLDVTNRTGITEETSSPIVMETTPTEGLKTQYVNHPVNETGPALSEDTIVLAEGNVLSFSTEMLADPSLATTVLADKEMDSPATTVLVDDEFVSPATTVLGNDEFVSPATTVLGNDESVSSATTLLTEEDAALAATEVLSNGTEVLERGTEVLGQEYGTTVLFPTEELTGNKETDLRSVDFKMIKDIKIIHTSEVI